MNNITLVPPSALRRDWSLTQPGACKSWEKLKGSGEREQACWERERVGLPRAKKVWCEFFWVLSDRRRWWGCPAHPSPPPGRPGFPQPTASWDLVCLQTWCLAWKKSLQQVGQTCPETNRAWLGTKFAWSGSSCAWHWPWALPGAVTLRGCPASCCACWSTRVSNVLLEWGFNESPPETLIPTRF